MALDKTESWKLEKDTREQADCEIWFEERKNRIIASRLHEVWRQKGFENHAKRFTSPSAAPSAFLKRKFEHGHMYEPVAWQKYQQCMSGEGHEVCISQSDVAVNPNNPWLGCTPHSNIIFNMKCGIRESKCPYDY